jgi:hypothetical protein
MRAGPVRREIPDKAARGLYYIIEVSNFRSFASRTRINGKPVKISHGNVPLSVARKLHADVLQEVKQGNDPRHAKVRARVTRKAIEADTFAAIVEKYFQIECGLKRDNGGVTFNNVHRTAKRRLADLERLVLPRIGSRPITLDQHTDATTKGGSAGNYRGILQPFSRPQGAHSGRDAACAPPDQQHPQCGPGL